MQKADFLKQFEKGELFAGVDVWPLLKKATPILETEFGKLTKAQRTQIADRAFSVTTGLVSWDIREMYQTEKHDYFSDGAKYGFPLQSFITVRDGTYFAGGVNYWWWGRLNKMLFDAELADRKDELAKLQPTQELWQKCILGGAKPMQVIGTDTVFAEFEGKTYYRPTFKTNTDLHKAISFTRLYRQLTKFDSSYEERIAWTQAGWFNDLSYVAPYKLNKLIKPSPNPITKSLRFSAGIARDGGDAGSIFSVVVEP
jgi:hypothetical protein